MTGNTQAEALFDQGIERYKAGESPEALIPTFEDICRQAPKSSPAWTCLAWLYLLTRKPVQGHRAATQAVKLNPQDPQARVNLVVAMLETERKGVRPHVELVAQLITALPELGAEIQQNIDDGLTRRPNWQSLRRVRDWLFST